MEARARDGTAFALSGPEEGSAVVLIHGLGLNRQVWAGMRDALARRYRVLAYDLYGHGQSAPPPPGGLTLSVFADQLFGLLDELGIAQAALAGFSLGGMINRRAAMDRPERVTALAVLNSPHERAPELQRRVEAQAADACAGGPAATVDAALERWFTPEFRAQRPETVALVRDWVLSADPAAYAAARSVLAHGVTELIRPDPPIRHPALVMTSEHDSGSTPEMARAIDSEIAGAELMIVPGLRHLGLMEAPELFLDPLLGFLDHVLPAAGQAGGA